jgi:hypothetical protein
MVQKPEATQIRKRETETIARPGNSRRADGFVVDTSGDAERHRPSRRKRASGYGQVDAS